MRPRARRPEKVAEEIACKLSISCTLIKDNFYFINAAKLHYGTSIITLPTLKRQGNESEAEKMCVSENVCAYACGGGRNTDREREERERR